MGKGKRNILAASIAVAACLLAGGVYLLGLLQDRGGVVVQGLEDKEIAALRLGLGAKTAIEVVPPSSGNSAADLATRAPAGSLMILRADRSLLGFKGLAAFDPKVAGRFPPSLGAWSPALPLYTDLAVLSYDEATLKGIGAPKPTSLEALEKGLKALKKGLGPEKLPILVPGANDEALSALVSCLVAARGGDAAYRVLVEAVGKAPSLGEVLDLPLGAQGKGTTLGKALGEVLAWQKAGYLAKDWLAMDNIDVRRLYENRQGAMFVVLLSEQRNFDVQALDGCRSLAFPMAEGQRGGFAVTPVTLMAVKARPGAGVKASAARLASGETQALLADKTGRAPALSGARAADIQARIAREAALGGSRGSQAPAQGLLADAFLSRSAARAFSQEVRDYLRKAAQQP